MDCQYLPFCRFNFCRLAHLHPVCTVQLNLFRRLLCAGRRLSAKTLRLGPSKISCYMVYSCTARSRLDTTLVCETSDASTLYIHCTGYTVIRSSSTRRWSVRRLNVPTEWDQCWYWHRFLETEQGLRLYSSWSGTTLIHLCLQHNCIGREFSLIETTCLMNLLGH